jgi:hypothetical protein
LIKRYLTSCVTCGHKNTLRISLGPEARQEHTFACVGCGEECRIALDLDHVNREKYDLGPLKIQSPTPTIGKLENCVVCDEEGSITNLDPTFPVPEHLLHKDQVFPWMYSAREHMVARSRELDLKPREPGEPPIVLDVIDELGIPRLAADGIQAFCKAWRLGRRGKVELSREQLANLGAISGVDIESVWSGAAIVAMAVMGERARTDLSSFRDDVQALVARYPEEIARFREYLKNEDLLSDAMDRQVSVLEEYARSLSHYMQAWVFATTGTAIGDEMGVSSTDLKRVKYFYGEAFEQLATMLVWPACLNNISKGRGFEEFQRMTLKQYRNIDKAARKVAFAENATMSQLTAEFDSTLRNASHHGALRCAPDSRQWIEYRSGDTGNWKRMRYSDYLVKCNLIQVCLLKLLMLQVWLGEAAQ